MVAGHECGGHLGPGPAGTDRHTVTECFGHGHHIGLDPHVLEGEPPSGAAQAGLNLVHHQQDAPFRAQLAEAAQIVRRRDHHSGLAQDRLHQHGRHACRIARGVHGIEVAVGDVVEPGRHGQECRLLFVLSGGRQRGQGATVEGAVGGHHCVAVRSGPPAGQLDGALVGLGPRVGEEDLPAGTLHSPADQPVEGDGHVGADHIAEQVGDMAEGAGLGGHGLGHHRMGVPERSDGQTGQKVEIRAPLGVVQGAALAPHERDRRIGVVVHEGRAVDGTDRRTSHWCTRRRGRPRAHRSTPTMVPTPSSVKSSSSRACGVRPSKMWARFTP